MSSLKNVEVTELKEWLANDEAIIIDVREASEFASFRIEGATFMPLSQIEHHLPYLQKEKRKIVFQCLSGKRSQMAYAKALNALPDGDIYNLVGGIKAWEEAGFEVLKETKKEVMPMTRQVMVAAGSLTILFSLIGFCSSFGIFLTLLLGAGLLASGITGYCTMAMLLQKMPWNK